MLVHRQRFLSRCDSAHSSRVSRVGVRVGRIHIVLLVLCHVSILQECRFHSAHRVVGHLLCLSPGVVECLVALLTVLRFWSHSAARDRAPLGIRSFGRCESEVWMWCIRSFLWSPKSFVGHCHVEHPQFPCLVVPDSRRRRRCSYTLSPQQLLGPSALLRDHLLCRIRKNRTRSDLRLRTLMVLCLCQEYVWSTLSSSSETSTIRVIVAPQTQRLWCESYCFDSSSFHQATQPTSCTNKVKQTHLRHLHEKKRSVSTRYYTHKQHLSLSVLLHVDPPPPKKNKQMIIVEMIELAVLIVGLCLLYRACAKDVTSRRHRVSPDHAPASLP